MWSELLNQAKKDFTDLVETVKHDTSEVLARAREEFNNLNEAETFPEFLERNPSFILDEEEFNKETNKSYSKFSEDIDIKEKSEEIATLLKSEKVVDELFREVVPEKIKYIDFWTRFFFLRSQFALQKMDNEYEDDDENLGGWDDDTYPKQPSELPQNSEMNRENIDTSERKNPNAASKFLTKVTSTVGKIVKDLDDVLFTEEDEAMQAMARLQAENEIMRNKLETLGIDVQALFLQSEETVQTDQGGDKLEKENITKSVDIVEEDSTESAVMVKTEVANEIEVVEDEKQEVKENESEVMKEQPEVEITETLPSKVTDAGINPKKDTEEDDKWSNWE